MFMRLFSVVVLSVVGLSAIGCKSDEFRSADMNISLAPALVSDRVDYVKVVMIGVTEQQNLDQSQKKTSDVLSSETAKMSERQLLKSQGRLEEFDLNQAKPTRTIKANDPIWKSWKDKFVKYVYIYVDIRPGSQLRSTPLEVRNADHPPTYKAIDVVISPTRVDPQPRAK